MSQHISISLYKKILKRNQLDLINTKINLIIANNIFFLKYKPYTINLVLDDYIEVRIMLQVSLSRGRFLQK